MTKLLYSFLFLTLVLQASSQNYLEEDDSVMVEFINSGLSDSIKNWALDEEIKIIKPIIIGWKKGKTFKWFDNEFYSDTNKFTVSYGKLSEQLHLLLGINGVKKRIFEYHNWYNIESALLMNRKWLKNINEVETPKLEFTFLHDTLFRITISEVTDDERNMMKYFKSGYLDFWARNKLSDSTSSILGVKMILDSNSNLLWRHKHITATIETDGLTFEINNLARWGKKKMLQTYHLEYLEKWMLVGQYGYWGLMERFFSNYEKVTGVQGFNWGDDFKKIKKGIKEKITIDSSNHSIHFFSSVAGKDVGTVYNFINDKLMSATLQFGKFQYADTLKYLSYFDSNEVFKNYEEIKSLLFEKYGTCTNAYDGIRGEQQYFTVGDYTRKKEMVWHMGTTIISLSIDEMEGNYANKTYLMKCHYFHPDFFEVRKEKWKDEL